MKKTAAAILVLVLLCVLTALPALAQDVFAYSERRITVFEGETADPMIRVEGKYEEGGEIVYSSNAPKIATVGEDGVITAVKAGGSATITAQLKRDGKVIGKTSIVVDVARRVTKVTLSRKNLTVYEPADPALDGLVREIPEYPVILIIAGKSRQLTAVCTPENATNRKITFSTTDVGVAKIQDGKNLRGVEKGECELVVQSVQNPEITETFHVLVIEPVKKITIESPSKTVPSGGILQLSAAITPDTASIQRVTWTSRNPAIATVDENGIVTGIKKGQTAIIATAADGSEVYGSFGVTVTQDVTQVSIKPTDVLVYTGRTVKLNATVLPTEANDRSVTWTSSDPSIAAVYRYGEVKGVKAGECEITCTSNSNPAVSASVTVRVEQLVRKITFQNPSGLSMPVRTSQALDWTVEPEDTTNKDVTFKSSNTKVATVDQNGIVTAISKGSVTITATAADASRTQGTYRITVTQPVEGVSLKQGEYLVQLGRSKDIKATIEPQNANNQKVYWSIDDPGIADVRSVGDSTGRVYGRYVGSTTVSLVTDDGGYTASAAIRVDDFDSAVMVEGLQITDQNKIMVVLRNMSSYNLQKVYFRVDCWDIYNQPMIVSEDGVSTFFEGSYPLELYAYGRTQHGKFAWKYLDNGMLGKVVLTVTGYVFDNGQSWTIPEEYRVPSQPAVSIYFNPYATPPVASEESENG